MDGLFCGKRLDNGKWVCGYYVHQHGAHEIYLPGVDDDGFDRYHVDPETVRPFTGLYDCTKWEELTTEEQAMFLYPLDGWQRSKDEWKGRPIFRGDIVKHYTRYHYNDPKRYDIGEIYWNKSECEFLRTGQKCRRGFSIGDDCVYKIIGNIYDNKLEEFTNENN